MRRKDQIGYSIAELGTMQPDAPSWWLTPHRMLQTTLREIDATMDTDPCVREVQQFGANVVLFIVGGIVANDPTRLKYHWRFSLPRRADCGRLHDSRA